MSDFTDIMLPITCPVCQHTWKMETPSIPWRALPVSGKVICASCDTTLLVLFQEKDGQLHRSIKIEEPLPPDYDRRVTVDIECVHQFFELQDIGYSPMKTETLLGREQLVQYPYRGGKLVMCALCGERRQLWANGEILFFIDGAWHKKE